MQAAQEHRTVLLADDDADIRGYLEIALRCQGYKVETAKDGEEALAALHNNAQISAVLLDIIMPRCGGLETLKEIRKIAPTLPVIMVSGASSLFNIVDAMKNGATDFLSKPVSQSDVQKALSAALNPGPQAQPHVPATGNAATNTFFGQNRVMAEIRARMPRIGWSDAPALILGETGVGKEMLARELHAHSPRRGKAFLKVNCAALPSELVESELFGYERGAFTGAFQRKLGMFEIADGATIFLDEIGDMDLKLQAKLLQVLQDSQFHRLGGKETIRVDVRVVAATHRNLERAIRENTFREDLFYRMNVISLHIPPLRDRKEDLLPLTEFLIRKHSNGTEPPAISPELREAFLGYNWPGNVRELENVVRKLLILREPDLIAQELRSRLVAQSPAAPVVAPECRSESMTTLERVSMVKNEAEAAAIRAALESTHWNRKQAAVLLKIDYKALLYKMKRLSIK